MIQPQIHPIETYLRVIDRPVIKLTSVDLGSHSGSGFNRQHVRLCSGPLGTTQSCCHCLRRLFHPAWKDADIHSQGLLSAYRRKWQRNRSGQQDQRYSQGFSIGCLDKSPRLVDFIDDAGHQSGKASLTGTLQESDRRLVAARAILRRVDWRKRWRLAGFRWCLARNQTYRGSKIYRTAIPNSGLAAGG